MTEHGGKASSAVPEQELEGLSVHGFREFRIGETVVYAGHGAARIERTKTKNIGGKDKIYLVLKVAKDDMTIEVPVDNPVGVGDVVGKLGLDRVFEVLRATPTEMTGSFVLRRRANHAKLASGQVISVAEVVRDLWHSDKGRGLFPGEKVTLAKARQILVSQLAFAENTDEDRAESVLDEVLAGTTDEDEANTIQAASLQARRAAITAKLDAMGPLPSGV
jgi:CarD family transcriptional regulator